MLISYYVFLFFFLCTYYVYLSKLGMKYVYSTPVINEV